MEKCSDFKKCKCIKPFQYPYVLDGIYEFSTMKDRTWFWIRFKLVDGVETINDKLRDNNFEIYFEEIKE